MSNFLGKNSSLDGNVYIWHHDTGVLLEVLRGHERVVNAVAWNPTNEHMFASCSDDHNIRIWEPAPSDTHMQKGQHHKWRYMAFFHFFIKIMHCSICI